MAKMGSGAVLGFRAAPSLRLFQLANTVAGWDFQSGN